MASPNFDGVTLIVKGLQLMYVLLIIIIISYVHVLSNKVCDSYMAETVRRISVMLPVLS